MSYHAIHRKYRHDDYIHTLLKINITLILPLASHIFSLCFDNLFSTQVFSFLDKVIY